MRKKTGLWEVSPCLRKNLLTNGLLNYTIMSYVLYTIDIIADGLKSMWQLTGKFFGWQASGVGGTTWKQNGCAVELSPCGAWPWCFPFGHRSQLVLQHRCGAEESHETKPGLSWAKFWSKCRLLSQLNIKAEIKRVLSEIFQPHLTFIFYFLEWQQFIIRGLPWWLITSICSCAICLFICVG